MFNKKTEKNSALLEYEDPLDEGDWGKKPKIPVMSVLVDKVVRDDKAPKMKYDPSHIDANEDGYVAYPNINPVVEMADLIAATRSYQANVAAYESSKNMANSALSILRG